MRAWLDSVHAAVRRLREDTGVAEVALVGYRLGALLALVAAEEDAGIESLVLVAPVATGRMAVRELQALSRIVALPEPTGGVSDRSGPVNVVGFALTTETARDLAALDGRGPPGQVPARRALLLDRDGSPGAARIAARLAAGGGRVDQAVFTGSPDLVQQPQRADAAQAAFAPVIAWLTVGGVARGATPPPDRPAGLMMTGAVERPVFVGSGPAPLGPALFGIACAPVLADPVGDRPAILFLNSGATHHVGSGRATVVLARRLAALGYPSLRIDAAGIGDSPARRGAPDNLLYSRSVMTDVRAALDWLEAQGHERCVVVGLCAGGAPALLAGLGDERVVGQILLNPGRFELGKGIAVAEVLRSVAYRSAGGYLREALKPAKLRAMLRNRRRVAGLLRRLVVRLGRRLLIKSGLDSRVLRVFRRLSAEGRRVLLVYSVGDMTYAECELHLGAAGRCLHGLPGVTLERLERADHSLTDWSARERLDQLIDRHLQSLDSPVAATPETAVTAATG